MKIKELREKSTEELNKIRQEVSQKIRDLNFKVAGNQLKNVRELRKNKKLNAQILTLIKERNEKN